MRADVGPGSPPEPQRGRTQALERAGLTERAGARRQAAGRIVATTQIATPSVPAGGSPPRWTHPDIADVLRAGRDAVGARMHAHRLGCSPPAGSRVAAFAIFKSRDLRTWGAGKPGDPRRRRRWFRTRFPTDDGTADVVASFPSSGAQVGRRAMRRHPVIARLRDADDSLTDPRSCHRRRTPMSPPARERWPSRSHRLAHGSRGNSPAYDRLQEDSKPVFRPDRHPDVSSPAGMIDDHHPDRLAELAPQASPILPNGQAVGFLTIRTAARRGQGGKRADLGPTRTLQRPAY